MEKKYFVFGKAATDILWNLDDLNEIVNNINEDEAELFVYDPATTLIHTVLETYSRWSDYAYLTPKQYREIVRLL